MDDRVVADISERERKFDRANFCFSLSVAMAITVVVIFRATGAPPPPSPPPPPPPPHRSRWKLVHRRLTDRSLKAPRIERRAAQHVA